MSEVPSRLRSALEGRYLIERELGRGGMATVYLAQDLKHRRDVAIKVLQPELAAAVGAARFLSEIETTANLRHPHILPLFDSGQADSFLYYVMPYVDGDTLRARLDREGPLPLDEAIRITKDIAEALDHAHRLGVVHRDVKPANIFCEAGHAVVCDFGIAKAVRDAGGDRLTGTGLALGTPEYMSPEQATATHQVDARTDIYSLGCVLYEMLSGEPPYHGATPQAILARKVMEPPPGLRVVRSAVPPWLQTAVATAMAKVPADRFPSARTFADALSGPGSDGYAAEPERGTRVRRGALTAAALVAGAVFAAAWLVRGYVSRPRGAAPGRFTFAQLTAQSGIEDSPTLSPDGAWLAYAGDGPEGRDIFLQDAGGRRPINLTQDVPDDDEQPAFSPDGDRIAFRSGRDGGGIFVMSRTGEATRRVTDGGFNPAWSPDGTRLAYATEGVGLLPLNWQEASELWVVDVQSGARTRILVDDAVQPSWSPHGDRIAFASRMTIEGRMDLWTVATDGGDPVAITADAQADWAPAWSPDGAYLYFASDRGGSQNLWRIRVDESSGRALGEPEPVTTPASFAAHPNVAAGGNAVAYASVLHAQNVEAARLDWRAGVLSDPLPLTTGSRQWSSPDPSPDGASVVFYSRDLPEGDLYAVRGDGSGPPRQITSDQSLDRVPRWSPDGAWIAYFASRTPPLHVWVVRPDGSENHQVTEGDFGSWAVWNPDGSRIAVNGGPEIENDRVFLVDPLRPWHGQTVDTLPAPEAFEAFQANDWSPDGRRLAGFVAPLADVGIVVFDIADGTYTLLTDFGQWPVWLPDSRHILFVTGGKEFWIIDSLTRELRRVYTSRNDILGPPRITRDGTRVVYTRRATEADIWIGTGH